MWQWSIRTPGSTASWGTAEPRRLVRLVVEAKRREAVLDLIMDLAAVGPSDQSDAWIASKQRALHSDHEDYLVVATAQRLGVRMLVTNDAKLVLHSPVAAMTAADALTQLAIP